MSDERGPEVVEYDAIATFIVNDLLAGEDVTSIGLDDPLISSGVLDSLSVLKLLLFLEERFGLTIEDGEVVPANFETVREIGGLIRSKHEVTTR